MVVTYTYTRDYDFSGFQAYNPATPLPASSLDNELINIERAINNIADFINELGPSDAEYQPLDADLTLIAAANNGAVLAATTASFLTADEAKLDALGTNGNGDRTVSASSPSGGSDGDIWLVV